MPIVNITNVTTHRLVNGEYHLIIRKKGISFRKAHSDDPLDTLLILSLKPEQIQKVEFIERKDQFYIVLYASIPERLGQQVQSQIELESKEIAVSVLFEKLDLLFNKHEEIVNLELEEADSEEFEEDPLIVFLQFFETTFVKSFREGFQAGMSFVTTKITNLRNNLTKGFKNLNKFSIPFLKAKEEEKDEIFQQEIEFSEEYTTLNNVLHCFIDMQNDIPDLPSKTNNQAILFIPGIGFSYSLWKNYLIDFYNEGYRILSYDLRGHGNSQRPEKLKHCRVNQLSDDFYAFLGDRNLVDKEKELILVLFSASGMILLKNLEKKLPKSIKKIVLLSSCDHISIDLVNLCKRIPSPEVWLPLKDQAIEKGKELLFINPRASNIDQIFDYPRNMDSEVLTEMLRSLGDKKYSKTGNYKKFKEIKFLNLVGVNDPIFPPSAVSSFKEKISSVSIVTLEGANHFFPFEDHNSIHFTLNELHKFVSEDSNMIAN